MSSPGASPVRGFIPNDWNGSTNPKFNVAAFPAAMSKGEIGRLSTEDRKDAEREKKRSAAANKSYRCVWFPSNPSLYIIIIVQYWVVDPAPTVNHQPVIRFAGSTALGPCEWFNPRKHLTLKQFSVSQV
jgi:hypothetical protein